MKEPTPTSGDDVPDTVLEELLSAFSDDAKRAEPVVSDVSSSTALEDPSGGSGRERKAAQKAEKQAVKGAEAKAKADAKAVEAASKDAQKAAKKSAKKSAKQSRKDSTDAPSSDAGDVLAAAPPAPSGPATIVIGVADDLPELRYLDEMVEAGQDRGGRSTIMIGDDLDSTGAFDAVSVATRSMDPRVRARRIAVNRAAGRKRLLWAAGIVGVLLVLVAGFAVLGSSLFAVEHVNVQGNVYTDPERLQAVIDDLTGEPVLLVDTLAAERALEAIPWVERAIVTTDFPNKVLIDIRERVPLASFQGSDGRFRVIDRDGRVLDVLDGQPVDFLLITGQAPDTGVGGYAGAPFAGAAQLIAALPDEIRAITRSASVDAATGDLGLVLEPGIEVRIGSSAGLDGKLARLLQRVHDGLLGIVAIDVSTDEVSITRG